MKCRHCWGGGGSAGPFPVLCPRVSLPAAHILLSPRDPHQPGCPQQQHKTFPPEPAPATGASRGSEKQEPSPSCRAPLPPPAFPKKRLSAPERGGSPQNTRSSVSSCKGTGGCPCCCPWVQHPTPDRVPCCTRCCLLGGSTSEIAHLTPTPQQVRTPPNTPVLVQHPFPFPTRLAITCHGTVSPELNMSV